MASGGRESNVFSSDEEDLHCVKKRSKRPKAIVTSDSDSDSDKDFDKRPRKHVRPLDLASDESDNKYSNEASFSNETRVCSNSNEDSSLINDLSDNEQSEKCAICLGKFAEQDVATPETCDHMFCLDCLREWAKNVNTCPIDRLKFNLILVRHRKEDKIFKRISVNSPDSPWLSESESESIFSSETALCAYCDEHDDANCLYSCRECEKAFHSRCLSHQSFHLLARSGTCPDCALSISVRRFQSEQLRLRRSYNFESSSLNVDSEIFYRRSYNLHKRIERLLSLEKAKVEREIAHIDRRRRLISSSESSDEDTELTRLNAQQHRDRLSSRSQCTLHQKRRLLLGRSRNPALISTATSATTNSELYSVDSDDGNNDYRYDNRDHEQNHGEPSSSTRSSFSGQPRTKIITADERENYDVVGSILQTQTLILRPDVIKLQRDGTVLLSSDSSPNSRMNSSASSSSGNEERFTELPSFSNSRSIIPHTDGVNYKQQPLNPTQNSNSKYRETNRENYTCTSSTSKESSIDCDNMSISSRNAFQNSGNERYNDNSCSSVTHKSFCSSPTTEDIKKMSNFKESSKTHHSEDEVDIYSDIESIGDDEGVCSTIEGVGDRLEPMEISYKENQSPSSNPEAATDSSDNELVIDEDMAAEEESDNRKESIQMNNIKNKCENEQINESEESNVSYSDSINEEQKNGTPDVQDNSSCVDSRSVEDGQLGEESSQETFQSDGGAEGYKADSECDESKYGSECDESRNGSEYEENKNESESEENKNESECEENKNEREYMENKNGSEYEEEKNRSEDEDNNESVAEEIKNVSEYDDQESDMDVQVYEDNSVDSSKKSPRPETSTPCSTISSPKQYDEEMKEQESLDQCDNSISSGVQEFDDGSCRKDCENVDVSLMQTNENTSGSFSQAEENENYQHENNSNLSFESSQNVMSEPEEEMESNIDVSQTFSEGDKKLDEVQNEIKSTEYNNDEKENEINDIDFSENASTPCLDENIDGQIEDSPVHNDTLESADPDFKSDATEYDPKSCRTPPSGSEYEMVENDEISLQKIEGHHENSEKNLDNAVDLGIEDISEAGSGDLDDDFADENVSFSESKEQIYIDAKREDHANYEFNEVNNDLDFKVNSKHSDDVKYQNSSQSNHSFEEREEGEIVEDKPVRHPDHKRSAKFERYHDDNEDYSDLPRVNISDLPRIPKIKRDKEKESVPEELPIESKRTSVLGRVDLGGGDISWKRLSKHTRERSYRDGRAKEERVLYRERESRKRDKKYPSDNEWRSDSKSSRRDDSKKDSEKLRNEYDSRSRKNDRKVSKVPDWDYSDRDKRNKSHKDKHKDKHRDKKEKPKHDKGKHSKDDTKYSRERSKDDRYERELKLDKEQRFERVVHEKGKCKDKDHKNKHKDRKNDNKSGKDHSREKHKHIYVSDHFSEKQREREVRKIDDKLKIVVEQKEGRKEKLKHKDKKESKHDKKQIHHHEHRKKEVERSPYTELTSIESKEIFAKGDSIIINVSFNRTNSPKDTNIDNTESSFKDRKSEEFEVDDVVTSDKNKKHSLSDKGKSILETPIAKRPVTPPERTNPVLSVSECYWQGGEDSDANSADSEKSVIEITNIEEENGTMESADPLEGENFSSSFNSNDATETQTATKEITSESDKTPERIEKVDNSFVKESENLAPPPKRRSPRSPSPPSPADNDSYDPCEPTRSPSPPPMPLAPPLPTGNPKPPPSPELPPLPPEPEPIDNIREETIVHKPSEFSAVSSVVTSSQPVTANTQTSVSNPISMSSMLLPPPSFMSHTPTTTNSIPSLSSLLPPNFSFQVNNHSNAMFQSNHVQQVNRGIVPSQMHGTSAIPPPPNPPSLPHMSSVPPPPPPPSAMALISQVRHSQMNVRPTITPNQILQNLTMGHPVTMPQMQLTHMHHLPPNLSNALNNHQSPMMIPSQNQSLNLPVSIQNQPVSRVILSQNQMLNHSVALQNQNIISKPQGSVMSHQSVSNNTQKSDKIIPEKTEVIDMDVDSPYSPGDSPSMDSVCDYSPTCSPLPSSPKSKDIFDSLLPIDHRTSDRKTQDILGKTEKLKRSKNESDTPNKRAKHEHKRHSVRMQLADKNKSRREQRVEKKLDDSQLKILDELPSSAVEMQVKEKFLKKLNRQERVVEEVKLVLKPYYKTRDVTKEEYKDILRKAVPKICHNKSGEINPVKVRSLVESYVKKIKHSRKKSDKKKSSKLS